MVCRVAQHRPSQDCLHPIIDTIPTSLIYRPRTNCVHKNTAQPDPYIWHIARNSRRRISVPNAEFAARLSLFLWICLYLECDFANSRLTQTRPDMWRPNRSTRNAQLNSVGLVLSSIFPCFPCSGVHIFSPTQSHFGRSCNAIRERIRWICFSSSLRTS